MESKTKNRLAGGAIAAAMMLAVPFIISKEGESLTSYRDIAGVWTICHGETLGVGPNMRKTPEECKALTESRTGQFMQRVYDQLKFAVPAQVLAAHTSFAYNVGIAGYQSSTTLRETNAGNLEAGCRAMAFWVCITVSEGRGDTSGTCKSKATNKRRDQGLVNRRNDEIKLCLSGLK